MGLSVTRYARVEMREGRAAFELEDLFAGKVEIQAGDYKKEHELSAPISDLVIQVDAPHAKVEAATDNEAEEPLFREVEVRFIASKGHPAPSGRLKVVKQVKFRKLPEHGYLTFEELVDQPMSWELKNKFYEEKVL